MEKKMIQVDEDVHEYLYMSKLIPREPFNDVIKRIIRKIDKKEDD